MIFDAEQRKEFEKVVKPVMEYLRDWKKFDPHCKIVITYGNAEYFEGKISFVDSDVFTEDRKKFKAV